MTQTPPIWSGHVEAAAIALFSSDWPGEDWTAAVETRKVSYLRTASIALNAIPVSRGAATEGVDAQALDITKRIEREFYYDHPGGAVQVRAKVQSIIAEALASPAHPVEDQEPPEIETKWRELALQFDGHRMEALGLLRMIVRGIEEYATARDILREPLQSLKVFLASPPLSGERVLAQRIEALSPNLALEAAQTSRDAARANFLTMQGAAATLLDRATIAEAQLKAAREALEGYDAALANREHGGLAAHRCADALRTALVKP